MRVALVMAETENNSRRIREEIGPFLTLGLQLALAVGAFSYIGYLLDGWLDTRPWFLVAGAVVGCAGGMIKFFRSALEMGARADRAAREKKEKDRPGR